MKKINKVLFAALSCLLITSCNGAGNYSQVKKYVLRNQIIHVEALKNSREKVIDNTRMFVADKNDVYFVHWWFVYADENITEEYTYYYSSVVWSGKTSTAKYEVTNHTASSEEVVESYKGKDVMKQYAESKSISSSGNNTAKEDVICTEWTSMLNKCNDYLKKNANITIA